MTISKIKTRDTYIYILYIYTVKWDGKAQDVNAPCEPNV